MAKPIEPTPTLHGQAAIDFLANYYNPRVISKEERQEIAKGADRIKAMLTFEF